MWPPAACPIDIVHVIVRAVARPEGEVYALKHAPAPAQREMPSAKAVSLRLDVLAQVDCRLESRRPGRQAREGPALLRDGAYPRLRAGVLRAESSQM